ncbi:hypothetical protein MPC4_320009 [Methylocella tundrae]|uniref:Uncharacterized protein n=1 Tax=Methylocella tundrae TaxID=227605 RepID=A0A8B6M8Q9_METTU|nr:hypothetical protein MPC4_320009 [Methylocella tundrae]
MDFSPPRPAQAFAGQLDAVGVVDEAIEDGVGGKRAPAFRQRKSVFPVFALDNVTAPSVLIGTGWRGS